MSSHKKQRTEVHNLKIALANTKSKKLSKYKNTKTEIDGIVFDSKAEANRYQVLKNMERMKLISDLTRQVTFFLDKSVVIRGRKKPGLKYVADFTYIENGVKIVEDCKGVLTDVFKIKEHLMKSVHGIDILVTK